MSQLLLEVVEGPQTGAQLALTGSVEAGRSHEAALTLEDDQVSRHHARFEPAASGGVMVSDLGSVNGTYVNEQPILAPRELRPGDQIRLGVSVIELRTLEQVEAVPSAAQPRPPVAQLGSDVLEPAREAEMPAQSAPPEAPPGEQYAALAALVDTRVKRQTSIAVFALLSAAGLAVAIFFGVR